MDNNKLAPNPVLEASMLNWAPGIWPVSFNYNGVRYHRHNPIQHGDEIVGFRYHSTFVAPVKWIEVLND